MRLELASGLPTNLRQRLQTAHDVAVRRARAGEVPFDAPAVILAKVASGHIHCRRRHSREGGNPFNISKRWVT